mmetsp:Transcript_2374/g.10129  ORF Transcript_2374/g.10129 Transcript_2374/m.10129 type:complete len:213 (+) Transcript_2374:347-985(+)
MGKREERRMVPRAPHLRPTRSAPPAARGRRRRRGANQGLQPSGVRLQRAPGRPQGRAPGIAADECAARPSRTSKVPKRIRTTPRTKMSPPMKRTPMPIPTSTRMVTTKTKIKTRTRTRKMKSRKRTRHPKKQTNKTGATATRVPATPLAERRMRRRGERRKPGRAPGSSRQQDPVSGCASPRCSTKTISRRGRYPSAWKKRTIPAEGRRKRN